MDCALRCDVTYEWECLDPDGGVVEPPAYVGAPMPVALWSGYV
jgi:hypothetical protein